MKRILEVHQKYLSSWVLALTVLAALLLGPSQASATSILDSAAQSFAVLSATVSSAHSDPNQPTQIYGNLGGTSVSGFPPGQVSGGTILDASALTDATAAYNTLAGLSPTYNLTGLDLGGLTLTPGVYRFDSSAQLTGKLTLDFTGTPNADLIYLGNPNADFIFQIKSALTTASASSVDVIHGSSQSGVYWQVVSSATLGDDTMFAGNILALASVTLDPRAKILCGRAFALTGAVDGTDYLISNNNTAQDFGSGRSDFGSHGFSGGAAPVPEPCTMLLLGGGLLGLTGLKRRNKKS
jgi:type VI secretion system secreted protein VgrG